MKFQRMLSTVFLFYVILGSWKGYLALYEAGAAEPRQIYPAKVSSLPQEDQDALAVGIIVRNDRDLQELLEDYLS